MAIILVCGNRIHIEKFCSDFRSRQDCFIYTTPFSEAISDVIQADASKIHIITTSLQKPERYITFCHAKRFKTAFLVIYLKGKLSSKSKDLDKDSSSEISDDESNDVPDDLEIPNKGTRHDNPLIISHNYNTEPKDQFFENIFTVIARPCTKKSYSNEKILKNPDFFKNAKSTMKEIQSKYPYNLEIFLETEDCMMKMINSSKNRIDVETAYEEMLRDELSERGLID